jgi:hypothetical protein
LSAELQGDRAVLSQGGGGGAEGALFAPLARHQAEAFGLGPEGLRLPEHFRGPWEEARVCFLGPHAALLPEEPAPGPAASDAEYVNHYRSRPERRDPYGHYSAIMDGAPWVATELIHWPCQKEFGLKLLAGPAGPAMVAAALDVTWAMLRESPAQVLVLTGNDALKWVLPHLGWTGGKLPGVTQLHGQHLGRFPLPGAPGREISVVASFHWSKEMPMFVRKVAGLGGGSVREAVSGGRAMIAAAIAACGV